MSRMHDSLLFFWYKKNSKKNYGKEAQPSPDLTPSGEGDTHFPLLSPHTPRRLDYRAFGARPVPPIKLKSWLRPWLSVLYQTDS